MSDLVEGMGLPVLQQVPVVAMHVSRVRGRTVEQIAGSQPGRRGEWAFRREYRSTYRAEQAPNESLVTGRWRGAAGDTVHVSLEEGIAAALGVGVGDSLVFDVQGVPVGTVVGSLRQVDWQRLMPSFFVVFPTGVLEEAPQFHVLVTRADARAARALLQQRVVRLFPNVSVIDLDLVLRTVDAVLARAAVVVRLVAAVALGAGVLLLAAVVWGSRLQRRRESALLRALGASRRQVARILLAEYLFLGGVAGLAGVLLALAGGWGLARFVFEVTWAPPLLPLGLALLAVPALTVLVGAAGSRGVQTAPPLEAVRRAE
ncbi:MAG: FtsX-like permease family protein [Candidatus Latescibacterota bacterium]